MSSAATHAPSMPPRIAITGVGLVTPIGHDYETFAHSLWNCRSAIDEVDLFDVRRAPCRAGGQVRGFQPRDRLPRALVSMLARPESRKLAFGCAAVLSACEDAGFTKETSRPRLGLSLGSSSAVLDLAVLDRFMRGKGRARPTIPSATGANPETLAPDYALRLVGRTLGVGPCVVHLSTCAASAIAIKTAADWLRCGELDVCIAGGFDSMLTPNGLGSFGLLGALSTAERAPRDLMRPFDRRRDGMVIGEGAVAFTLERLDRALARGATPLAELSGVGASMDAHHLLAPHPDGAGAAAAMRAALRDARIPTTEVDYVNAHGTATLLNDPVETRAIRAVFGPRARRIPISSSKPYFGHLIGGSGAIEVLVALAALRAQRIPPTLNLRQQDPECDLDFVPLRPRRSRLRVVMSNSFGFGGYNASVLLRELAA